MGCILLVASACLFVLLGGFAKRVPDERPDVDLYKMKEDCPDECIYIKACGKGNVDPDNPYPTGPTVRYYATGSGDCDGAYGLNVGNFCPILTRNDCYMKCGGEICAFHDTIEYQLGQISPSLFKVYQILNDTKIDIWDDNRTWYYDYIKDHNQNGTYFVRVKFWKKGETQD